jgi:two-component system, chemotaxis family, chemotaxis protein CheY
MQQINRQLRILVVDDFPEMRTGLLQALAKLGFESVRATEGGLDAIRLFEAGQTFDLIISDLNMPQMSGLELLNYVRNFNRLDSIPFLMITAEATKANVLAAAQAGVTDFIVKPFSMDQLMLKIERLRRRETSIK